ncbi:MAG: SDR family oxidoreductase [Bacteriovoracia bacterium]
MYVVITGASRGIGLELVRAGLEKGHQVLGIARRPHESVELMALSEKYKSLSILQLDILSPDAVEEIKEKITLWPCVDVLVNNAGIYLDTEKVEDFEKSFLTNTIKPFFLTKGLMPLLKKSERPLSLQISSQMGSLNDNTSGGAYSYRASKAALNMLFKSLAIDESWLISLLVHPGWVRTRMGGDGAPILPEESAEGIWKIIEGATLSRSGQFLNFRQESLPW